MRLAVASSLVVVAVLLGVVSADLYMHNPPGSNDRNRERNDNRRNGDRLFDSQNNGKGGYPWRGSAVARAVPDPLTYYTGSVLRMEWTNQHACGPNPNVVCDVVIQYACDTIDDNLRNINRAADSGADLPGLRDGYPSSEEVVASDNQNTGYLRRRFSAEAGQDQDDGTNTIPEDRFNDNRANQLAFYTLGSLGGVDFGMHEHRDLYALCKATTRNRGLYTADQQLNRNDARATRQNPNGARRGLECPEERDYYPYWNAALNPWHDVAVLTNDVSRCDFFKANSPNVRSYGYCSGWNSTRMNNQLIPITRGACEVANGGRWIEAAPKGPAAPDCLVSPYGRDNHLGNAAAVDRSTGAILVDEYQPETASYLWTIPDEMANKRCIVRMRYNMSTLDYASNQYSLNGGTTGVGIDSSRNCPNVLTVDGTGVDDLIQNVSNAQCIQNLLTDSSRPLTNRPYVDVFRQTGVSKLSIALNTNQAGRTFQDRSYVFDVRPATVSGKIWNLNVRGRRGNIVQAYPAVEYDFVPSVLKVTQGDWVHIQIHGSDFNEAKNANNGEGWQFSDRSNMVQYDDPAHNIPSPKTKISLFPDTNTAIRWALLDQTNCGTYVNGQNNEQNAIDNCGKLNRAPNRFPPDPTDGLMQVSQSTGSYYYGSTRNNNFSNRSHKARLIVGAGPGLSAAAIAGITVGSVVGVGLVVGGLLVYGKKRPGSALGGCYRSLSNSCTRKAAPAASTASTTGAPDMTYQRH